MVPSASAKPVGSEDSSVNIGPLVTKVNDLMMVIEVANAQYARYFNEALAKGTVKIDGDNVVGYYLGDAFHGHKHEIKIDVGDWLHVPLRDPSLRLTFDGSTFG